VFVVLPSPGEGDAVGFTPVFEASVDEFRSVAAVQAL
jgi:hypothetical protein